MNIKQAREYYDLNVLTGFEILRDPMTKGWLLMVIGKEDRSWTLETALGKPKVYSSIDSIVTEVERIVNKVSGVSIRL
jgi:hypothetical protein